MRLGMREVPRTGAGLVRKTMRIARNSFEDDEASKADFSALARLHLDSGFSDSRTRRICPFSAVSRSRSPASCFGVLLLITAFLLCLPLSLWLAWQPILLDNAGGRQRKPEPGLIDYDEVSPSHSVYSRAFPVVRGKRARGTVRPRGPPVRPTCHREMASTVVDIS